MKIKTVRTKPDAETTLHAILLVEEGRELRIPIPPYSMTPSEALSFFKSCEKNLRDWVAPIELR